MDVFMTDKGGDMARFGVLTGKTREIQRAAMFGGASARTQVEIEAFEIVHPDDSEGMEKSSVPDWISERECGIGRPLGKEWV